MASDEDRPDSDGEPPVPVGEDSSGDADGAEEPAAEESSGGLSGGDIEKGKEEYNKGNYAEALKSWQRSMKSVKYITDKGLYKDKPDQLAEVAQMEQKLWLNMAQGYLKVRDWGQAVDYSNLVLAREPENSKALYRKAQALYELNKFTEACETIETLLTSEPENAAAKALLAQMRRGQEKYREKAKKLSKKMLSGIDRDPRRPTTQKEQMFDFLFSFPTTVLQWISSAPSRFKELWQTICYELRGKVFAVTSWARRKLERLAPRVPGAGADKQD
mmetsp:Transcript_30413/g.70028  ORF Transcript_30413/g.70028 Transcript_30413/m.70028 type:complete len:274 (-) Transcript_30413:52-873(-)